MPIDTHYLAIDLGGTLLRVAIADGDSHLVGRQVEPTNQSAGPGGVVAQIAEMSSRALAECGMSAGVLVRAAIACPGPLNAWTGEVLSPPNLAGWRDVPLRAMLEQQLRIPVVVSNDANAAALGEYLLGAGRGTRNFVYLTVSTGIGGGAIVDGRVMEGTHGMAGEIGHTTIDMHGPVCKCGNIGCLEALASGTAIADRFMSGLRQGQESSSLSYVENERITAADVMRAASAGEKFARSVFTDAATALGFGVLNCVHTFNPEVVALGGGVTHAGALLFEPVRRVLAQYAFPVLSRQVRIVPAELGDDVGLVGAACVAASGRARRARDE